MSKLDANSSIPNLIIIMGVSGSGKSTVAKYLSDYLDARFVEADDFHSFENRCQMQSGRPLNDDMREPWIAALESHLSLKGGDPLFTIMAYSGLKRSHRNRFRRLGYRTLFLYLELSEQEAVDRSRNRKNHFMPPKLVASQFDSLERPDESDIVRIDASSEINQVYDSVLAQCRSTYLL